MRKLLLTHFFWLFNLIFISFAGYAAPQVVVSIKPIHSLAAGVMQGVASPILLLEPPNSPHYFQLRPSHAKLLQEADLMIWVGPDLENFLSTPLKNLNQPKRLLTLAQLPEIKKLPLRNDEYWPAHDHSHDHSHEHKHESTQDDHHHPHPALDGANMDAHLWLDTDNAQHIVNAIAAHLTQLDPIHAEQYAANAQALTQRLAQLTIFIQNRLKGLKNQPFLVFHDAYQYFEARFDLPSLGAIAAGDASDPGPARIEEVRGIIRDGRAACVFSEPEFNQSFVQTVIDGTGAQAAIIDPLGSAIAPGPQFYPALLRAVATGLAECAK
jgi:zinc transport system substrate-binding protein